MTLRDRIKRHEGYSTTPYQDTEGFWTVGIGRCMDKTPFSDAEIEFMFDNDLSRAFSAADMLAPHLTGARREVVVEMCFQMGAKGVSKFRRFLAATEAHQWDIAAKEMLASKWAVQTPGRAKELAEIMREGR